MVLLLLRVYLFFSGVYCGMFSPGLLEAGGRCSEGFWEVQAGMGVIPKVWNFAKIVPSCCKQPPWQCFGAQGTGWNGWNHQCTASCCCFCCCFFFFVGVCFCRLLQPRQDFSQAQKGLRALPVLLRFISVGMRPRISKADKILLETFFWGGEVHAKKGGQVDAVLVIFGNKNAFWRLVRIFVVGRWYWRYLSSRFQVKRFDCFSLPWILPTFLFEGLPKIGQGGSGHTWPAGSGKVTSQTLTRCCGRLSSSSHRWERKEHIFRRRCEGQRRVALLKAKWIQVDPEQHSATFYFFGVSIGWRPSFDHVLGFTLGLE